MKEKGFRHTNSRAHALSLEGIAFGARIMSDCRLDEEYATRPMNFVVHRYSCVALSP